MKILRAAVPRVAVPRVAVPRVAVPQAAVHRAAALARQEHLRVPEKQRWRVPCVLTVTGRCLTVFGL